MSLLIEMPDETDPLHFQLTHDFHSEVAFLLDCPEYRAGVVTASTASSIRLVLPKSPLTFVRDTRWLFELKPTHLRTVVTFIDCAGTNLMRAQSERMKLQLMILLRLVNSKLPLEENYTVDPRSGTVQYTFQIPWKEYAQKLGRTHALRKLFGYLLYQLNFYAEILFFCEGGLALQFPGKQFCKQPPKIQAINRFRFLLRNTNKFREANVRYLGAMVHLKAQLRGNAGDEHLKEELERTLVLFNSNVRCFESMRVGLEEGQSQQKIESCLKHIACNAKGFESNPSESNIVKGIAVVQRGELKSLSKEGAHSEILRGCFLYRLYLSTNPDLSQKQSKWTDGKEIKGELVVKKCNSGQSSINSFLNQMHFLNYIRSSKSSYIARYYLEIKSLREAPNEKELIYMRRYTQNMHGLVKKSVTLSIMERLSLSYKLAKGFCFLGYRSVLHRDFKPHNIVMDQTLNPFIIDFGSCVPVYGASDFRVCQPRLLATKYFHIYYHELPQQYNYLQSKFTREQYERHPLIDVYSFGRILSFLFFKSIIPPSSDDLDIYPYPDLVRNIYYLVGICLQVDPDDRPTFAEIASFLGTLDGYTKTLSQGLELKIRSCSEPKPKIQ